MYSFKKEGYFTMQTQDTTLFTATEAAVLTRLPLKSVNNAIDKKTVPAIIGERAGQPIRLLDLRGLMSLSLERRYVDRFAPELRREMSEALEGEPRSTLSLDGGSIKIDLREPRRELAESLRQLRRARQLVVSDQGIMGGAPVFRGTRVPVHMIADILALGETEEVMLESYPSITVEMLRLAPVYASAYPLMGRPRKQPWHDQPPVSTGRRKLASIEVV
jgi:uncharacterized protein (DUF433 family)